MFGSKIKVGLALGGGGARGFSHLGAIKAFEEFGVSFDYICGTSAGSIAGAFLANGFKFQQIYDIAKSLRMKDIRTNIVPFTPSKLDGVGDIIIKYLGDIDIENLKTPFSAVAVDLVSTKEVVLSKGSLAKAVMGSCAVPGVFTPIEYDNMILADGGLQNTIPADIPRFYGCDYVISVDVNKSRTYGTKSTKLLDVLSCSIRILMKSNAVSGYLYSDVVIAPETKRFKSTSPDGFEDMIEEGYKATIDAMPKIMAVLNKHRKTRKLIKPDDVIFYE